MPKPDKRKEETRRRLREAISRLCDRRQTQGNGILNPTALALEAGVGRATVYRFPEILEKLDQLRSEVAKSVTLHDRVRELEAELRSVRAEDRKEVQRLRALNNVYAQRIQILTLALQIESEKVGERDTALATLKKVLDAEGKVVNFPLRAATE